MSTPPEIRRYADLIMTEIGKDITDGLVPATVASFSELHDYVDANDYALEAVPFSGPECNCPVNRSLQTYHSESCLTQQDEYRDAWGAYMELLNAVETEVSERLRARQS